MSVFFLRESFFGRLLDGHLEIGISVSIQGVSGVVIQRDKIRRVQGENSLNSFLVSQELQESIGMACLLRE